MLSEKYQFVKSIGQLFQKYFHFFKVELMNHCLLKIVLIEALVLTMNMLEDLSCENGLSHFVTTFWQDYQGHHQHLHMSCFYLSKCCHKMWTNNFLWQTISYSLIILETLKGYCDCILKKVVVHQFIIRYLWC